MQENQLHKIHRAVSGFLRAQRGLGRLTPDRHEALVRHVQGQLGETKLAGPKLHGAVLVCALGPARPAPTASIVNDLIEVAERSGISAVRLPEIAIAYGCGKWREISITGGPWTQEWPGAMRQLTLALESPVRESNVWLSEHLVGYPGKGSWHSDEGGVIPRDAAYLAWHLTCATRALHAVHEEALLISCCEDGTDVQANLSTLDASLPPGSRAVFEVRAAGQLRVTRLDGTSSVQEVSAGTLFAVRSVDDGTRILFTGSLADVVLHIGDSAQFTPAENLLLWTCSCGNRNCAQRHRLEAWEPSKVSLWSYLASAVKGPSPELKLGAFITGMYLPILSREGTSDATRVRTAEVEFKLCQSENCASRDPQRKYEGARCPSCKAAFSPNTIPRDKFERLIVVGEVAPYERLARYYCRAQPHGRFGNGNLYEAQNCPICGAAPRTRRPTHVWTRTFARAVALDDDVMQRDRLAAEHPELLDLGPTDVTVDAEY